MRSVRQSLIIGLVLYLSDISQAFFILTKEAIAFATDDIVHNEDLTAPIITLKQPASVLTIPGPLEEPIKGMPIPHSNGITISKPQNNNHAETVSTRIIETATTTKTITTSASGHTHFHAHPTHPFVPHPRPHHPRKEDKRYLLSSMEMFNATKNEVTLAHNTSNIVQQPVRATLGLVRSPGPSKPIKRPPAMKHPHNPTTSAHPKRKKPINIQGLLNDVKQPRTPCSKPASERIREEEVWIRREKEELKRHYNQLHPNEEEEQLPPPKSHDHCQLHRTTEVAPQAPRSLLRRLLHHHPESETQPN